MCLIHAYGIYHVVVHMNMFNKEYAHLDRE